MSALWPFQIEIEEGMVQPAGDRSFRCDCYATGRTIGSTMVNSAPLPNSDSTEILPPCPSTMVV